MAISPSDGALPVTATEPSLELREVVKRFGSVTALEGVDFEARAGEVHALLGENGAGKTTLTNIVAGIVPADGGVLKLRGDAVELRSPRDAFGRGVGVVHQHFRLIEKFTVAQSVHLGWDETPRLVSDSVLRQRTKELSDRFALPVDPGARVWQLSTGERQRVAILRALARGARILFLDEPTAALTPAETAELFVAIRKVRAAGHTVIFISHKLNEVLEIADRITVLRGGRNVSTLERREADRDMLAALMIGHDVDAVQRSDGGRTARSMQSRAAPALSLQRVRASDDFGRDALADVDLEVSRGEIVGVAGVSGNGQRELADVIVGLRPATAGTVRIDGQELTGNSSMEAVRLGVGYIPETIEAGAALACSVEVNAAMKASHEPPLRNGPWLRRGRIRGFAAELLDKAALERVAPARKLGTLSGGQAQRLVAHRELVAARCALVAVHPTRGLDVAGAARIHELLLEASHQGIAVLLISEDLDEVLALSDRVVVIYEGRITRTAARAELTREEIGALMGGVRS